MSISSHTIQLIKDRADILEVVGDFVSLKKKGNNWWSPCPFHNEKTASFSVNAAKGIYKCFGCGKAGDAIKFVMDVEGVNYPEALRYLAKKYQIEIEEKQISPEQLAEQTHRESLLIVMNFAKNYYHELLKSSEGKIGLSYFKERGFSEETIKTFELGYSLDQWNALEHEALRKGYEKKYLEQTGLLIKNEEKNSTYDRFRGRVMFPIHDLAGKTIAFGARILIKDDKQPKYINSPETEIYHKSDVLYGIFQAKNEIRKQEDCLLTEGYADVVSLHQAGIRNVVASSGTSLTEPQIRLIKRFSENITVLYDGDAAGIKAAMRGIDLILQEGLNVKAVLFPEGEDPDSYVRVVGGEAFKNYVKKNAKDFVAFKTDMLLGEAKHDPLKKTGVAKDIIRTIAQIPDNIKRQMFAQQCAEKLDLDKGSVLAEINKILFDEHQRGIQRATHQKTAVVPDIDWTPPDEFPDFVTEEIAHIHIQENEGERPAILRKHSFADIVKVQEQESIKLLLRYGERIIDEGVQLYQYLLNEINEIDFHTPIYKEILDIYKRCVAKGIAPDADFFIEDTTPHIQELVINLTYEKHKISDLWESKFGIFVPHESNEDRLPSAVYHNILRLKLQVIKQLENEVMAEIRDAETQNDLDELLRLMHTNMELSRIRKEICKPLGIVVS